MQTENEQPTAVDDVRKVREQIDRESAGDIRRHIDRSNRVLEEYREKLGLKIVPPPSQPVERNGTGG
jgi:hypothetical protein